MNRKIKISNKIIDKNSPVFIIGELSANHNHKYEIAVESIKAIKDAGADAVKLQTYTPDTITINCDNKYFRINHGTLWDGKNLYDLYKEAYTPWEWQPKLKKVAEKLGLVFLSTPFDKSSVDFLEKMSVPVYKIASFEITDIPLIEYVAAKNKPVIISTGIATLDEIKEAINACLRMKNNKLMLLKCVSEYPAPVESMNLRTIQDLARRFNMLVGLSDHSTGISVPIAATALGAKIIEKHFILDRKLGGPDAAFSADQNEFANMVKCIREAESALGKIEYKLSNEIKASRSFARSLFVVQDIKKGNLFTEQNIRSIRPAYGLPPKEMKYIFGRKASKNIRRGTPLNWRHVI